MKTFNAAKVFLTFTEKKPMTRADIEAKIKVLEDRVKVFGNDLKDLEAQLKTVPNYLTHCPRGCGQTTVLLGWETNYGPYSRLTKIEDVMCSKCNFRMKSEVNA